ncbi:hypothetical protein LCGC14_2061420, partial [marine sediment metagenome]
AIYVMASMESFGSTQFIELFLSPDHSGIRFRALILVAPFISTIVGYMVYERERLMRDLEVANRLLEEHLQEKDEFITRLGHDIKTPLTPLINLLPLARKRTDDGSVRSLLDVTIQNANTLKELVLKTLKMARASRKYTQADMEVCLLADIVDRSLSRHEYAIGQKNMEITSDLPGETMVKCNNSDIEDLLGNLISNAIRFSHDGGYIIISSSINDKTATVSVRDFGLGLTKEQEDRVFEPFYKADESRHELDSSGLGLSICKKIAENHGGTIWAESPGQWLGTTISFTIPKGSLPRQWRK